MERVDALKLLLASAPDDRLRAARCLNHAAIAEDIPILEEALARETQRWVKSALTKALLGLRSNAEPTFVERSSESAEERMLAEIYAEAVEDTTHRLVHEISAIIGRLNVYASSEFRTWHKSKTREEWSRLQQLVGAIDQLSQAAAAPALSDFNLVDVLQNIVRAEQAGSEVKIEATGLKPLIVVGARDLIQIVVGNALRNALEATSGFSSEPVVVTWGETDKDYWIAVLDRGRGLPESTSNVFEIGTTTKRGHLGMGLALARQAARSMNGSVSLTRRKEYGARFEFRWPKIVL